jgi:hypothetical protein
MSGISRPRPFPVLSPDGKILFSLAFGDGSISFVRSLFNRESVAEWGDLADLRRLEHARDPLHLITTVARLLDGRWFRIAWEEVGGQRAWVGRLVTAKEAQAWLSFIRPPLTSTQQQLLAVDLEREAAVGQDSSAVAATHQRAAPTPPEDDRALRLIPGGFSYRGTSHDLAGRPREMLEALLGSPERRLTADQLRVAMKVDDAGVVYPEQVVRDTAGKLRAALRAAAGAAGQACEDPLPSIGRGRELTYTLAIS